MIAMAASVDFDFAMIGAQKSASTFLQLRLRQHPMVDMPTGETRAFQDPWYSAGGPSDLERLFAARSPGVRRGIKRPDYLADPDVPARLAAAVPTVRLIATLRDPVPRAVSAYFHYIRLGFLPYLPLDVGFPQVLDGRLAARYPRASEIIEYGFYGRQLTRYLDYFPGEQLAVLLHTDVRDDAEASLTRMLAHVGLDGSSPPGPPASSRQANQGTYHPVRIRLLRSRNRFMFEYTEGVSLRTPRRMSPWGWAATGAISALDRAVLSHVDRTPTPRLNADMTDRLREIYREDTDLLESLLGRGPLWGPASHGGGTGRQPHSA